MLMEAQLRVRLRLNAFYRASSRAQSPLIGSVVVIIGLILTLYVNHKNDKLVCLTAHWSKLPYHTFLLSRQLP